jgi:AraC-like DNA-binding protein/mannose-6-phosphate isomerase-like protein (cupin superfamily)
MQSHLSELITRHEHALLARISGIGEDEAAAILGDPPAREPALARMWEKLDQNNREGTTRTVLAKWFLKDGASMGIVFHSLENPNRKFVLHNHDYFELSYVLSGSATHFLADDGQERLGTGDVVLLSPHVRHELRVEPGSCVVNLVILPDLLRRMLSSAFAEAGVVADYLVGYFDALVNVSDRLLWRAGAEADAVGALMEQLILELDARPPAYEAAASGYLTILFVLWARQYDAPRAEPEQARLLAQVVGYIADNYNTATLTSTAMKFGYSPTRLSRLLQASTGKGFAKIIVEYKLRHARRMLGATDLPVSRIARNVGFSSASYLTRVFREQMGLTPGEYRSNLAKDQH